ncbi:hypothetical protein A9Q84_04720 [Halobacteriovorax marinus]|uniref:DUF306 domain-containing protein n=1 Tax=Halobacteriovorax marinus TaxID=97084 RepID=A0A1Y5FAK0_9BACT|nr:hypothetical protein A9Q84_04720 [Halobacteriovorax marinus]
MNSPFLYIVILTLSISCKPNGEKLKVEDIHGKWMLTKILENPVIVDSSAHFNFQKEGELGGHTSCNNLFGKYEFKESKVIFSKIGTTKMLCHGEKNSQEISFTSSLPNVAKVKIEEGELIIENSKGEILFRATKAQ